MIRRTPIVDAVP